jgi:hypothetical protein
MDELSFRRKACVAARGAGASLRNDAGASGEAGAHSFFGVAEIITLDTARPRMKTPKPNDPPNVPIDEHIGRQLKAIYDDVLNQPIPDRFLDLLNQLGDEPSKDEDAS